MNVAYKAALDFDDMIESSVSACKSITECNNRISELTAAARDYDEAINTIRYAAESMVCGEIDDDDFNEVTAVVTESILEPASAVLEYYLEKADFTGCEVEDDEDVAEEFNNPFAKPQPKKSWFQRNAQNLKRAAIGAGVGAAATAAVTPKSRQLPASSKNTNVIEVPYTEVKEAFEPSEILDFYGMVLTESLNALQDAKNYVIESSEFDDTSDAVYTAESLIAFRDACFDVILESAIPGFDQKAMNEDFDLNDGEDQFNQFVEDGTNEHEDPENEGDDSYEDEDLADDDDDE